MGIETVRELVAKLGLEIDDKTFKVAETLISGLKTGLFATIGATAGVVGGLLAVAQSTANAGNEARKGALRTGLTTDAYQELKFAAEAAGADVGSLETALFRMSRASYQARQGSTAAAAAFHGLLTFKDLKNGTPDEQFEKMAEGLSKIKDPGERANRAMTIFGRGIQPLLPLLTRGKEGIEELRQEFRESGALIGPETIANAKEYAANLHKTEVMLEGLKFQLGGAVLSALVKFQRWVHKISESFAEWRKAHPDFFLKTFRLIIAGLGALAIANAAAVGSIILEWAALAAASVSSAATVVASWVAAALPFLGTAAAVALLALVIEDLYGFVSGKQSFIGDMTTGIRTIASEYTNWRDAVADLVVWLGRLTHVYSDSDMDNYDFQKHMWKGGATGPRSASTISQGVSSAGYVQSGTTPGGMTTYLPAGVTVNVHAAPGMDEGTLAQRVAKYVVDELDKVTREAQAAAQ